MLIINIEEQEFTKMDEEGRLVFFYTKPVRVKLEHSLISISKWEAIWEKPFLPTPGLTPGMSGYNEELSYMECMIIGSVPDHIPTVLINEHSKEVRNYIEKEHTATKVYRRGNTPTSRQIITSELIYYWMIKFGIPFECAQWHFNRLLMLIDVCNVKESAQGKGGKLSNRDALSEIQRINKKRRGL